MANAVNKEFQPPAIFDPQTGTCAVDCKATPPTFGVQIGGQAFYHNGADLVLTNGDGTCISSLVAVEPVDGVVLHFLGDPFLKNVVAVFDFGENEMRFAAREDDARDLL